MYHYIRPEPAALPHFRYLHIDDFRRQLDHFAATEGFVDRSAFLAAIDGGPQPQRGFVLTFDDGFGDHWRHVLPELQSRGLWGIFYVPTGVYDDGQLLDVHRIHYLLGRIGGGMLLEALERLIRPDMLSPAHTDEFRLRTYRNQENDAATTEFKRLLNYFVDYAWRDRLLDQLMECFADESALANDWYMSTDQIAEMQRAGMIVGSHSVSHPVFSRLDSATQEREINESFAFLERATGGLEMRTFCYPYGGFHSFTAETERLLDAAGCRFSFNVEPRDIALADLRGRPQALPRYDCNMFPHGAARMGSEPEVS